MKRDDPLVDKRTAERATPEESPDNDPDIDREEVRVLVVEDHPALRDSLAMFLEFHGYTVVTASDFQQALAAASTAGPDVAVCDRQLNQPQDGIDVARALQHEFGTRLVFVSGTSLDRLRAETVDLDVLAYIKKPALPNQIEAAVRLAARGR